jgi:excisionase family DNA binding protein
MQRTAFSIAEAAEAAGVGTTKVRAEIRQGHLLARRLGKRVVIPSDDLASWIASLPFHRSSAAAEPRETAGEPWSSHSQNSTQ